MKLQPISGKTRRQFLQALLAAPITAVLAACSRALNGGVPPANETAAGAATAARPSPSLVPTPACADDDDDVTLSQTEGPFYTPDSPERTSLLEPGMAGTKMMLMGTVIATDCRPIAGALVDFWHADDNGVYDNVGYRLRGHQFADEQGRYTLETIVPGLYPGRTRHFHVKVQPAGGRILTTQLYFPNEPDNARDGIFRTELLMDVVETAEGIAATFNFVLDTG